MRKITGCRLFHSSSPQWEDVTVDWSSFDLIVLRTPWGYHLQPEKFSTWLKTPIEGDFRVQREHGGTFQAITPKQEVLTAASAVIKAIPHPWLYARVDGVVINSKFHLMELELIEPDLYLEFDQFAPKRFAESIAAVHQR